MRMETCVSCGQEIEAAKLLLSDKGSICELCNIDQEMQPKTGLATPALWVGAVAVLLPFVIRVRQSSISFVDGKTIVGPSISYIALAGGATALVVSLLLLVQGWRADNKRAVRLTIAGVIFGGGLLQIARGFVPFL